MLESERESLERMFAAGAAAARQVALAPPAWLSGDPIAVLRMALAAPDLTTAPDIVWHGAVQHVLAFQDEGYPVRVYLDAATGLPSASEALVTYDDQHVSGSIAWNALGDITERTEYMNWSFADGLRYPFQQDHLRNGTLARTLAITSAKAIAGAAAAELAVPAAEIPAPASVQQLRFDQPVPGGPYPGKPASEIAPGIVQLPNSWYTTIVRQDDGLVIIDAPISAGYSASVLAEAARRFPGVPVKALITSTGFFWHVAGVREYAARGIPIYAEARNVPVLVAMLSAPHSLRPDALARASAAHPRIIPVTSATVIGRGAHAITIYPVAAATQPMLMSYIADARLLHTAEMVQPLGPNGTILFPESLIELTTTVAAQAIAPERIIGMHMSPTPWSAVAATLRAAGATVPAPAG
jgi:glyoxylase-like metal-dependent hydrolase (beta-lactamase superfamily II)